MVKYRCLLLLLPLLFFASCNRPEKTGQLILTFETQVDGQQVDYHELHYVNAAGNTYQIDEVRYFISQVKLHSSTGKVVVIENDEGLHYYDSNIPETFSWTISDEISEGLYDSVSFVVGLPSSQNVTGHFVNPPENNMAWPEVLGGGYHYMQINGKWLNTNNSIQPFNLHTGIGQVYENAQVTQFVDNSFEVKLALKDLKIEAGTTALRALVMNVNNWFCSPNVYDFNEWGGAIMQNQAAQEVLRENGRDVFFVK